MKKILLAFGTILLCTTVFSQGKSNVIVFSENAEPFYLFLNGAMQNGAPETNVRVNDIDEGMYAIKIMFQNTALKNITKSNAPLEAGKQYTFRIKQNKKGDYVLRYFGEVAIDGSSSAGATDYTYSDVSVDRSSSAQVVAADHNTTRTNTGRASAAGAGGGTGGTVTTTTTETVTTEGDGESVSVSMSFGGISMDVNASGTGGETSTSTTTSSTSTTTTTSTTTSTSSSDQTGDWARDSRTDEVSYTGGTGCYYPESDISDMKTAIENEDFGDDKLRVAKQIAKNKCLKSAHVAELAKLFDFEDNRLEFAKFAYDYTYDQDNYYLVNEAFEFSTSKDELNEHIDSK